jgi:hypothetical protein
VALRAILPLAACAALVLPGTGAAALPAPIVVKGTVTLDAFDVKECRWGGTKTATVVGCTVYGAYTGLPGPAGAGYGWVWTVPDPVYGKGRHSSEHGTLVLNFGPLGGVSLSLAGKQKPVGTQTAVHAKVATTGTWRMTKGTSNLADAHGRGTYTYTVIRNGSNSVFSVARLRLSGTIG